MLGDYVLITDSNIDMPHELAEEWGLQIIPFMFTMDGTTYLDYLDRHTFPVKDFYNALREGKQSNTSLITEQRYIEVFEPLLKEGKDILYLAFSSGLSSSYGQSLLAAEHLKELYPERKLIAVDSLCASAGQGLLAYYMSQAKKDGKTIEENVEYIKSLIPHINHWVKADDLNHLRRGGRVSGASAFLGTMLNIKPIIIMNDEGKLIPVAKARGRQKAIEYLVDRTCERIIEPKDQLLFICHSDAPEDAQAIADMVSERTHKRPFIIGTIGPVIGSHTGPGTVVIASIGTHR
jgi:DegV family protein with EDD domain